MPLLVHHKHPLLIIPLWLEFPCLSPSCHTIVVGITFATPLWPWWKMLRFSKLQLASHWKHHSSSSCCNPLIGLPGAHNLTLDGWIWADNSRIVLLGLCICTTHSLPSLFPVFLVVLSCTYLGVFSTFSQCHPEVDHSASVLLASCPGASLRLVQLVTVSPEFWKYFCDLTTTKRIPNHPPVQVNELASLDPVAIEREYDSWVLKNDDGLIVTHHSLPL